MKRPAGQGNTLQIPLIQRNKIIIMSISSSSYYVKNYVVFQRKGGILV